MTNKFLMRCGLCLLGGLLGLLPVGAAYAQQPATPIPVVPPTATPTLLPPTNPPTRTPTSQGPASVTPLEGAANVRAQPDINAERLGQIQVGQNYAVLGKYFEWYQIQFPDSPSGIGWVHQSVVQVLGDPNTIPDLTQSGLPTEDPILASRRQTLEVITITPGGVFTLTAEAQITPTGVFTLEGGAPNPNAPQAQNLILPTFTFPPTTPTPIDLNTISRPGQTDASSGGMPPIVPIAALIGLGSLGLLITGLRRL